ncbi:MAG TPA: hypothetical protein P5125_04185 [Kiritimatiellia bacterium]|nr:hypothetical protein [Kiritimatiellia bacterium]HOR97996.1 hypothetical protein [Kiritimatiellia bacterium]HPK38249.1 hypothetical protein [Kiritimatiellia bacterium]HPW75895.1 hypothetical protein [Kiritimatiellia bacterium]HRU19535.1 hypothetical protein [Kiritimatiellia bacterium]
MTIRFFAAVLSVTLIMLGGSGCTTSRVIENTRVPEITIEESGTIRFNQEPVEPGKLVSALRSGGIRTSQEVNILIPDQPDRALMRAVSAELLRGGYSRTVFVKNRKATSSFPSARKTK